MHYVILSTVMRNTFLVEEKVYRGKYLRLLYWVAYSSKYVWGGGFSQKPSNWRKVCCMTNFKTCLGTKSDEAATLLSCT